MYKLLGFQLQCSVNITVSKYEISFGAADAIYRLWYAMFDVFTSRTNMFFSFSSLMKSCILSVGPDIVQLVELLWQAISTSGCRMSLRSL